MNMDRLAERCTRVAPSSLAVVLSTPAGVFHPRDHIPNPARSAPGGRAGEGPAPPVFRVSRRRELLDMM